MKVFEIGKEYEMRVDDDCYEVWTVTGRTATTVTATDGRTEKRLKISKAATEAFKAETVYPLGSYSMAPTLRADRPAKNEPADDQQPQLAKTGRTVNWYDVGQGFELEEVTNGKTTGYWLGHKNIGVKELIYEMPSETAVFPAADYLADFVEFFENKYMM